MASGKHFFVGKGHTWEELSFFLPFTQLCNVKAAASAAILWPQEANLSVKVSILGKAEKWKTPRPFLPLLSCWVNQPWNHLPQDCLLVIWDVKKSPCFRLCLLHYDVHTSSLYLVKMLIWIQKVWEGATVSIVQAKLLRNGMPGSEPSLWVRGVYVIFNRLSGTDGWNHPKWYNPQFDILSHHLWPVSMKFNRGLEIFNFNFSWC